MSQSTSAGVRTRLHDTVSRVPNPLPEWASWPLKFVVCAALGSFVWLSIFMGESIVTSAAAAPGNSTSNWYGLAMLLVLVLPSIGAGSVYRSLPNESVDFYHRFGKASALFITTNIILSIVFVLTQAYFTDQLQLALTHAGFQDAFTGWVMASFFLPGVYLGVVVATRWAK